MTKEMKLVEEKKELEKALASEKQQNEELRTALNSAEDRNAELKNALRLTRVSGIISEGRAQAIRRRMASTS